jgi:hypothetical protein
VLDPSYHAQKNTSWARKHPAFFFRSLLFPLLSVREDFERIFFMPGRLLEASPPLLAKQGPSLLGELICFHSRISEGTMMHNKEHGKVEILYKCRCCQKIASKRSPCHFSLQNRSSLPKKVWRVQSSGSPIEIESFGMPSLEPTIQASKLSVLTSSVSYSDEGIHRIHGIFF